MTDRAPDPARDTLLRPGSEFESGCGPLAVQVSAALLPNPKSLTGSDSVTIGRLPGCCRIMDRSGILSRNPSLSQVRPTRKSSPVPARKVRRRPDNLSLAAAPGPSETGWPCASAGGRLKLVSRCPSPGNRHGRAAPREVRDHDASQYSCLDPTWTGRAQQPSEARPSGQVFFRNGRQISVS